MGDTIKIRGRDIVTRTRLKNKTYSKKHRGKKFLLLMEVRPMSHKIERALIIKSDKINRDLDYRLPTLTVLVDSADSKKELKDRLVKYSKVESVDFKLKDKKG